MKNLNLVVWLTQLGMSVAIPPVALILIAVWLRARFGWGKWVVWSAIIIGLICAVDGFLTSLRAMERMEGEKKDPQPPVSFNDHD